MELVTSGLGLNKSNCVGVFNLICVIQWSKLIHCEGWMAIELVNGNFVDWFVYMTLSLHQELFECEDYIFSIYFRNFDCIVDCRYYSG